MEIIQYKIFQNIRDCARIFGYHNKFTIQGIRFNVDPGSVGKTPLGEITALGAIEMIKERNLSGLKVLDIGCGVGIIGVTMFAKLFPERVIAEMSFADINFFNLNSLRRVLHMNDFAQYLDSQIYIYLSDVLEHITDSNKFDLIISNPPDFFIEDFDKVNLSGALLGRYSPDWHFHRQMYAHCHHYLTEKGEVWFLENRDAMPENIIKGMVSQNRHLQFIDTIQHCEDSFLYWSIVKKMS